MATLHLADFVKKSKELPTIVNISSSNTFLIMLQYIYGLKMTPLGIDLPVAKIDLPAFAKEIIEIAKNLGCD